MSRVVKRVLIEQAELDKMQQRQLCEYSPELHSMAAMYRKSLDILSRQNLSDGNKLRQLYAIEPSFNQLKGETKTHGSKPTAASSESATDAEAAAEVTAEKEATQAPAAPPVSRTSPMDIR